jgi:hypothetical protein
MIRTLTFAIATCLATASAAAVDKPVTLPGNPPADVVAWLQPLAGRAAIACGTHPFAKTESAALACAADAIRQSKPFWIVFEDVGLDYTGWTGVVSNAEGRSWSIRFDAGSSMAHMERPHSVNVFTCGGLSLEGPKLRCLGL